MRISMINLLGRDHIQALLSLPRSALRTEKFQESSLCTCICTWTILGLENAVDAISDAEEPISQHISKRAI
jgi:hypothetical protein